jgi:hypothetical protein
LVQVQAGATVLKNKFSGREETAKATAIYWVGSMQARDELAKGLRLPRAGIHVIGDAAAPRRLLDAVAEGHRAGILVTP